MNIKRMSTMGLITLMLSGFIANNIYANKVENDMIICLDAGQYIDQPGKRSPDGYQEVAYTLSVVKKVKKEIESQRPNVKVIESNADGTNTGIGSRGKFALQNKSDFLLSLHMDSVGGDWQNKVSGFHYISQTDAPITVKNDIKNMVNEYEEGTNIPRHMSTGFDDSRKDLTMLECVSPANASDKNYVPSSLLEMSFMDHEVLAHKLRDDEFQNVVAKTIANSLIKNVIDNPYYENDQEWERPIEENINVNVNVNIEDNNPNDNIQANVETNIKIEENTGIEDKTDINFEPGIVEAEVEESFTPETYEEKIKTKNPDEIKVISLNNIQVQEKELKEEKEKEINNFEQKVLQGNKKEAQEQIDKNIKEIRKLIDEMNLMTIKMKQETKEIEDRINNGK